VTFSGLTFRSLSHYWRLHLIAGLAAALGTAVLTGALLVGDSVRYSLHAMALERLGRVQLALNGGDRFFRDDLPARILAQPTFKTHFDGAAALLAAEGVVIDEKSDARVTSVQVLGITDDFIKMSGTPNAPAPARGEVVLNERLAGALGVSAGSSVRLRFYKPGLLSYDAPMGSNAQQSVLLRATVKAVILDRGMGRFDLRANQIAPYNAFVHLADLQEKLEQKGRANTLLLSGANSPASSAAERAASATALLKEAWSLDDAQLRLRAEPQLGFVELSTPRVFLDDTLAAALQKDGASGITTYFVNAVRNGASETPYSMVTAAAAPLVPADLKDDEIVLNQWTADDLNAKPGDTIELEYYVMGLMRALETQRASFKVKEIVPIAGLYADRKLLPDFPGIAEVDSTGDWKSSIPIDMKKIRPKDEEYWKQFKGTPKAFITAATGARLWKNRFGIHTALRFPLAGKESAEKALAHSEALVRARLSPADAGLSFLPVKAQALAAADQAIDFGMLFLGFSFFLIMGAVLLMALTFSFNIEARAKENVVLLALGFSPATLRNLLWMEGVFTAAIGSIAGTAFGTFYARWLLELLGSRWRAAVGTTALEYHAEPVSLVIGCVAGIGVAAAAIFFAARRHSREMLAAGEAAPESRPGPAGWVVAGICFAIATGIVARLDASAAGAFFAGGGLLLIGALSAVRMLLAPPATVSGQWRGSLARFGVRAASRRGGRSLATAALLACGSFLVIAVGANKKDAAAQTSKESGTGGFALHARSTIPIFDNLNTPAGRQNAGLLDENIMSGVTIYSFRVKSGDEASCLNLNRAQSPRILGVPQAFVDRGGFSFTSHFAVDKGSMNPGAPWSILDTASASERITAVCDNQSLTYALGKSVGDTLDIPDEKGVPQKIWIGAAVANSILQGNILISEADFLRLYPSESGYREFFIDVAPQEIKDASPLDPLPLSEAARAKRVAAYLEKALEDAGFSAMPAVARLAAFNAVENTYLSTFQALGALGMLLGSLGLGLVVLRNVLERRGELALMRAVGFSKFQLGKLVLSEYAWLMLLGLGAGIVAALVAVLPALRWSSNPFPWSALSFTLIGIVGCGFFSALLATWAALRGELLDALRTE